MKNLYLITGQTVVWAHSKQNALSAIDTIDKNDMWLISPDDVQLINHRDDLPVNWDVSLCPVDSDRALSDDIWAGKSTMAIINMLEEAKKPKEYTIEDRILEMEMSIAKLAVAIDNLASKK